eukprot:CAMPEP_0177634418 /NCGR_PEP_ID=MMETSP0447-20121125/3358_1 /TAXON_ID=0 /ORGANISM="Stygamoeba regulata, Strain BSH-02190019" /LENGTH=203 /DNA_ID=CAMNT_0019136139 /DNA_START=357 /DNA_END=964 /DNA_ORIENTATION=-
MPTRSSKSYFCGEHVYADCSDGVAVLACPLARVLPNGPQATLSHRRAQAAASPAAGVGGVCLRQAAAAAAEAALADWHSGFHVRVCSRFYTGVQRGVGVLVGPQHVLVCTAAARGRDGEWAEAVEVGGLPCLSPPSSSSSTSSTTASAGAGDGGGCVVGVVRAYAWADAALLVLGRSVGLECGWAAVTSADDASPRRAGVHVV